MTLPSDAARDDRSPSLHSSQPAWDSASAAPPRGGEKPATVRWGLGILWVGVALTLVLAGVGIVLLASVGGRADADERSAMMLGTALLLLAIALVGVQAWLLVEAGKGRGWARIALAVACVASLVIGLVADGSFDVGTALTVVAVVLLFVPASNDWYASQRRARSS